LNEPILREAKKGTPNGRVVGVNARGQQLDGGLRTAAGDSVKGAKNVDLELAGAHDGDELTFSTENPSS
jgi:hypothetical protein